MRKEKEKTNHFEKIEFAVSFEKLLSFLYCLLTTQRIKAFGEWEIVFGCCIDLE